MMKRSKLKVHVAAHGPSLPGLAAAARPSDASRQRLLPFNADGPPGRQDGRPGGARRRGRAPVGRNEWLHQERVGRVDGHGHEAARLRRAQRALRQRALAARQRGRVLGQVGGGLQARDARAVAVRRRLDAQRGAACARRSILKV